MKSQIAFYSIQFTLCNYVQLSTIFIKKLDLIMNLDLQIELKKSSCNYENTEKGGSRGGISLI